MKITVLLLLLTVCEGSSSSTIVGQVGHNITLPCTYDINHHGSLSICWGRGQIPHSGCNNQLISTDGQQVIERASNRYQLAGRLNRGDISLTILNVTEKDSGQYGCRVHIRGWFNDQKTQIQVIVKTVSAVQTTTAAATAAQTASEQATTGHTAAQLTSTESHMTSFETSIAKVEQQDSKLTVTLVCVLFALITALTIVVLVIISRRMFKHWKSLHRPQWLDNPLHFNSSSSTLYLQRQNLAVDNIYQVYSIQDEGAVYEFTQ